MAMEVLRAIAMTNDIHLRPHTPSQASSSTPPSPRMPLISSKGKERSLPALPIPLYGSELARTASPGPSQISARKLAKSPEVGPARSRPHSLTWSTFASRRALSRILKRPRILVCLLELSAWGDIHALISTCKEFRHGLFGIPECRGVLLGFYVPGYLCAAQSADMQQAREVKLEFHDLTLLVQSQFVPLHKYPMLSLSLLNRLSQDADHTEYHRAIEKYVALTQAHSRLVLLLQALVHSTPTSPLADDYDDVNFLAPQGTRVSQFAGMRELVFPAPLAYGEASNLGSTETLPSSSARGHRRTASHVSGANPRALSHSPSRASSDFHALLGRNGRPPPKGRASRRSILGSPRVPPPPPAAEPIASQYVKGWTRAPPQMRRSLAPRAWDQQQRRTGVTSMSEDDLKAPHRRFTSTTGSSESSLVSPPSSRSQPEPYASYSGDSSYSPATSSRESRAIQPTTPASTVPRGTSPHDLFLATSRTRAPVLRTFVPCTVLDDDAVAACEEQLEDAELWEHLSVGDVVCNFGYVPPVPENAGRDAEPQQEWLLFDGAGLALYAPPAPPPLEDPLSLPSPFYYAHILPPWSNPHYVLSLPALPRGVRPDPPARAQREFTDPHVQLTLTHVPARVRSPHSPQGYAVVRKFVWIARLPYVGPGTDAGAGLGRGWQGEWMIEGEGTKEGRQCLLDALRDGPDGSGLTRRGKWEVIRDKSGNGRLWMKLLIPNVDESSESVGSHI